MPVRVHELASLNSFFMGIGIYWLPAAELPPGY